MGRTGVTAAPAGYGPVVNLGPPPPRWLLVDGRRVAPVEVPETRSGRARGLLGRDHVDGAVLLLRTRSVHTFGMRIPIDVARCTSSLVVVAVETLPPGRMTLPRLGTGAVLEAGAGAFERWGLTSGSQLAVSGR